jgi:DNA repair protein RecO (recombination protein O)
VIFAPSANVTPLSKFESSCFESKHFDHSNNLTAVLKTRGIIFRTVKYGETSIIADIFTEEKGLQSFIAGNVRSAKSAMSYSLFQPMQVVEMVSYFREDKKVLNRLKEVRLSIHFQHIPFDVKRGAVVLFMAEVLRKCIREQEEEGSLFQFLVETLELLDQKESPIALIPTFFLAQLTEWLGFKPSGYAPADGQTIRFDLKEGITVLDHDPLRDTINPETTQAFFALIEANHQSLKTVALDGNQRKLVLDALLKYYRYHIDGFDQLNAHEVLNTVFHG